MENQLKNSLNLNEDPSWCSSRRQEGFRSRSSDGTVLLSKKFRKFEKSIDERFLKDFVRPLSLKKEAL